MCEYDHRCTKRDDPRAVVLWQRRKQADLVVYCPTEKRHIIAAVFALPGDGDALCTPPIEWGGALTSEGKFAHLHAGLRPLHDLIAAGNESEWGRCRDGTWSFRPSTAAAMLADWREGRLMPSGDLVKVRQPNGQVTRLGRGFAESRQLDIVGPAKRDPRLERPYTLGNYVKFGSTSGNDPLD